MAGHAFALGSTTVVWTVTDNSGNTATCDYIVTVIDNIKPTITCVGNQTRNADAGVCTYTAKGTEFDPLTTGDNCSVESVLNNLTLTDSLAGHVFEIGTTNVLWTITDGSGNTKTCSYTVFIHDILKPVGLDSRLAVPRRHRLRPKSNLEPFLSRFTPDGFLEPSPGDEKSLIGSKCRHNPQQLSERLCGPSGLLADLTWTASRGG